MCGHVISVGTRIEANTRLCNRLYHRWDTVSLSGVGVVMGVRDNTRLGGEVGANFTRVGATQSYLQFFSSETSRGHSESMLPGNKHIVVSLRQH